MNSHESQPKLPTWIFILTDVALLGAAALIGATSARPFSSEAMFWMSMCVIAGAVVGLVPVVARYERLKNETLDDRQRALEALARTVHSSAEQISIATGGLHEIADLAQKNLRHAEHLPQKLQEKIAEFQAQLSTAADTEKEELERELLALRTSESERLDTVSQRIAKSSAEWAKLETATQQHLAAANEALGKLARGTADAIGKAQAAAEQALAQARTEAARTIGETTGSATRAIEAAKATALAELEAKFAAAAAHAVEHASREFAAKVAALAATAEAKTPRPEPAPEMSAPVAATPAPEAAPPAATDSAEATPAESTPVAPPKRPRKPKREEPASVAVNGTPEPAAPPPTSAPAETPPPAAIEPPPINVTKIPEIAPVAPHTSEPFAEEKKEPAPAVAEPPPAPTPAPRKRAKKTEASPAAPAEPPAPKEEPALALDLDAGDGAGQPGIVERVLTSDGATRLLVTAYIGIGNRLFIRGTGPGLSWEKGVPLQFVSIGKWRWETNDASTPVQFKLYKNDEIECASLGAQSLDPGHQQEVTAAF